MGLTITIHKKMVSKLNARIQSDSSRQRSSSIRTTDSIGDSKQVAYPASTSDAANLYPTPSECKTHLKLLKVFANLKEDMADRGRPANIPSVNTKIPQRDLHDDMSDTADDKLWKPYVERAAERFEKWWISIAPKGEHGMLKVAKRPLLSSTGVPESLDQDSRTTKWTKSNLPPIDVLMVLHSFMLNPRTFLRECLKYNMTPLWRAGFPWELINQYIDESTYQYNAPESSRRNWESTTKLKWNNNAPTQTSTFKSQPSIFPFSLSEAVIRQGAFIDVMQSTSWLDSPTSSLDLTLFKLLSKYSHFFTIMAENPTQIAVPTYAVDLAWHTHQLTPQSYYNYSIARTKGIFIDHDDKLGDDTLSDGFGFTKDAFEKLTDGMEEYGECLCWHCMTVQSIRKETPGMSEGKVEIKARESIAEAQYRKLESDFRIEVDRARRFGREMPDQEAFLRDYVWLHPDARPMLNTGKK